MSASDIASWMVSPDASIAAISDGCLASTTPRMVVTVLSFS
jgi:hypothetical protein